MDSTTGFTDLCTLQDAPYHSTITDVAWSPIENELLAVSYTHGSIVCLTVDEKASRQSQVCSMWYVCGMWYVVCCMLYVVCCMLYVVCCMYVVCM
jgi:hypothetical protein